MNIDQPRSFNLFISLATYSTVFGTCIFFSFSLNYQTPVSMTMNFRGRPLVLMIGKWKHMYEGGGGICNN